MDFPLQHQAVSDHVWRTHYQWCQEGHTQESSIKATWERVALAVSAAEKNHRDTWRERFRTILNDYRFLPAGRILANAGTARRATLFNCFAMGVMEDSIQGIFNALREAMLTLQEGGGAGVDFSTLRPTGASAIASGGVASGPMSFMAVWEAAAAVLAMNNPRGGTLTAILRCDHPDIEAFLDSTTEAIAALPHFKRVVAVTDEFMHAVEQDGPWSLMFPLGQHPIPQSGELCQRTWSGDVAPQTCLIHRRIPARALWEKICEEMLTGASPEVLFIDRINQANNLWYREQISAIGPSGVVPLPPNGACDLGSINLTRLVKHPFTTHAVVDWLALKAVAGIAIRFLDDVHDLSMFPLKTQERTAHASRRIGLGVTGWADMLVMLGLRYGCGASLDLMRAVMGAIRDTAYQASVELAKEKGTFPAFDAIKYGASPFVLNLTHELQDAIAQHGIRNSHLLAVAQTDTISLLADNVSSGIQPIAALQATRRVRGADGQWVSLPVEDAALRLFRHLNGHELALPPHLVDAENVTVEDQLRTLSTVQSCVDSGVASTIRVPERHGRQSIELLLLQAWEGGLKGCAVQGHVRHSAEAPRSGQFTS
jgi:ribonucleoside-diphosphate reductase alpha chain